MGFLDKILGTMRLNDDFDDDDFMEDDELDSFEEERPKRTMFKKSSSSRERDVLDDYDDDEEEPIVRKAPKPASKPVKTAMPPKSRPAATVTSSKISPIRTKKSMNDLSVCVIKPRSMEDAREITETLLSNCPVVLNMEGLGVELAQRIIDFTSGSCYAISGTLQPISSYIFIITPPSVEVSGDLMDMINGAFDITPMSFDY
ncbi:MAG: cell division protein SepF [Eubacteriales bacterium]|nr:cell division protein SepF [Eubacteriales bacterium]